jgi:hypothetical protein
MPAGVSAELQRVAQRDGGLGLGGWVTDVSDLQAQKKREEGTVFSVFFCLSESCPSVPSLSRQIITGVV